MTYDPAFCEVFKYIYRRGGSYPPVVSRTSLPLWGVVGSDFSPFWREVRDGTGREPSQKAYFLDKSRKKKIL